VRDAVQPPVEATLRDSVEAFERSMIERALAASDGNIAQAARGVGRARPQQHPQHRPVGQLQPAQQPPRSVVTATTADVRATRVTGPPRAARSGRNSHPRKRFLPSMRAPA
jgi:hypothetical protein